MIWNRPDDDDADVLYLERRTSITVMYQVANESSYFDRWLRDAIFGGLVGEETVHLMR